MGKKATVINIPGTFNSLDYSKKSGEIADNNDANGKYVGNLVNGSTLEYLINVTTGRQYNLSVQAAAGNTAQQRTISVYAKDALIGTLSVVNGNNWFAFAPIQTNIALQAGQQTLRFVSTGAVNIKDITIAAADTSVIVQSPPSGGFVYNGAEQTPSVTSVVVNGTTLAAETHYDVSYSNNKNAGIATLTIKGKGDYVALNIVRSFTIAKKDLLITLNPKQFTIKLGDALPNFSQHVAFVGFVGGDDESNTLLYPELDLEFSRQDIIVSCEYPKNSYVGNYRLQLSTNEGLRPVNYNVIFDDAELSLVVNEADTPIKGKQSRNSKFGILLEKNPITDDVARISLKTPEKSQIKITIYDNTGSVVFEKDAIFNGETQWDLRNPAGRIVANGSYLVIAQARGLSGKIYEYRAKLGVKR